MSKIEVAFLEMIAQRGAGNTRAEWGKAILAEAMERLRKAERDVKIWTDFVKTHSTKQEA